MAPHRRQRSLADLEQQVADFNREYPRGARVNYHPVIGSAAHTETTVREPAYVMSGHTAVCFVDGVSGCVALDALG